MSLLLSMEEAERKAWGANAPEEIPVFVHPLYELLRRERDTSAPSVMVATTAEGASLYRTQYPRMPRLSMERYMEQLIEVAGHSTHAVVFEEYDRLLLLRMMLPELPWRRMLFVPTNIGNATPVEIAVQPGENPWYPRVADAFTQIGADKRFVVYGGGFMPLPDPACAGTVLLFLLGLQTQSLIRAASPGQTAVLRP